MFFLEFSLSFSLKQVKTMSCVGGLVNQLTIGSTKLHNNEDNTTWPSGAFNFFPPIRIYLNKQLQLYYYTNWDIFCVNLFLWVVMGISVLVCACKLGLQVEELKHVMKCC